MQSPVMAGVHTAYSSILTTLLMRGIITCRISESYNLESSIISIEAFPISPGIRVACFLTAATTTGGGLIGRVNNTKIVSLVAFFNNWASFLLKVGSVRHKTRIITFPYGGFRGAKMEFQIKKCDYGVKILMASTPFALYMQK